MLGIDATIDALLPEWPVLPPEQRAAVSTHCTRFVRRQIGVSPAHVQLGILVALIAFSLFAFLHLGMRSLGSVPRERRVAALRAFAHERVRPFLVLERLLRSMTVVAFFEHTDVLAAIGEPPPSATNPTTSGATVL
jgi:hypothetical protein